ncbi:MAG: DUF4293 domain-containing protein [Rikenellaceae bacterium]
MIQRIQTIYMLCASALVAAALFMPLAFFATKGDFFDLYAIGLKTIDGELAQKTIYMFLLLIGAALLPIINIFLYKNRMLQIRLCVVEIVLLIGASAMMGLYYFLSYRFFSSLEISTQGFKPALMFPFIAIFFVYLAAKAIFKDELMIRSVDRIR